MSKSKTKHVKKKEYKEKCRICNNIIYNSNEAFINWNFGGFFCRVCIESDKNLNCRKWEVLDY